MRNRPCGSESTDNKKWKKKGKTLTEKLTDFWRRGTHKLIWNISTITDVFLDQKRVIVCEHMLKMAPREFLKSANRGLWVSKEGEVGMEGKFSLHPLLFRLAVSQSPGGSSKTHIVPSLLCFHIHLLSFDWERRLWSSKYFKLVSVCLCVPFLQKSLHFSVRVFPFFSHFLCYPYFGTFLSTWLLTVKRPMKGPVKFSNMDSSPVS